MVKSVTVAIVSSTLSFMASASCHAEERRQAPLLVQMLKEGTAKVSPDATSILDAKGRSVAKPVPLPTAADYEGNYDPVFEAQYQKLVPTADKPPQRKFVYTCSTKCAVLEKQCYGEEGGNIICMNLCRSERVVCEEKALKSKPAAAGGEEPK